MSERAKTLAFEAVAAVFLGLAVWVAWANSPHEPAEVDDVGQEFFPQFTDPLKATGLEIVKFDKEQGEVHVFKVALVNGRWCIPSHYNYPADAKDQLAQAATALVGLKKLDKVTDDRREHETYGVIEPDPNRRDELRGREGVGTRITMTDESGNVLASLIVGKKAAEEHQNIYYVRVPGQDRVYKAEIDLARFSTKFQDWIEEDLLKLNSWDIRRVVLDLYSVDTARGRLIREDLIRLTYDESDANNPWKLEGLKPNQELDTQKLNELRYALDDLKIIDVRRKPQGLGDTLRQKEGATLSPADIADLQTKGFYLQPDGQLLSNQGQVIVTTKDGVEYILLFGELAEGRTIEQATGEEKDKPVANRYLFITVRFNPEMIPKPELTPLPELPPEEKNKEQKDAQDQSSQSQNSSEQKSDQEKDQKQSHSKSKQTREDILAQRKRIQKENERKQKEYEEKVEAAKKKVKELRERFADWYYVIADEEYRKIRLTRDQIIKSKEKKEDQEQKPQLPLVAPEPKAAKS